MKARCLFYFFLLLGFHSSCQTFDIQPIEFPLYSIVELKGYGALLMGKSPTGNTHKINLSFVSNSNSIAWSQSLNSKGAETFVIGSDESRFWYLMDNLELIEGRYFFNQINATGAVKTSSSILTHILTKIFKDISELDFNEMKIVDIFSTQNALVHVFRYHNLKEKKYTELAFFMTHENLISYACFLGDTKEEVLGNGFSDHCKFIGSTHDNVYFAKRSIQGNQKGWAVKSFTTRGANSSATFLPNAPDVFEPIENIPFGATGRYHLKTKPLVEENVLIQKNGKFYLVGIVLKGALRELKTFEWKDKWELLSTFSLAGVVKGKNPAQLGVFPVSDGIGVHMKEMIANTVVFFPFDTKKNILLSLYQEKMIFNASRMILSEKKQDFAVNLHDRKFFFNYTQLNKPGVVKFEYIVK